MKKLRVLLPCPVVPWGRNSYQMIEREVYNVTLGKTVPFMVMCDCEHSNKEQFCTLDPTHDYMEDITLTSFLDDTTLTLGIGIITSGEIKSSALSSNSSDASGYRFIGHLGKNFDKWEFLFGYHRIIYSYESNESENPSGAGGTMVFGFGIGF